MHNVSDIFISSGTELYLIRTSTDMYHEEVGSHDTDRTGLILIVHVIRDLRLLVLQLSRIFVTSRQLS